MISLKPTKPIINGNYLARREAFARYGKSEITSPGSRTRHFLIVAAMGLIALAVLAAKWVF